jgi:DNA polymerase I-like protein with 3'-5' exonuclease and polymerase domains/uracil-DNA glycosylase
VSSAYFNPASYDPEAHGAQCSRCPLRGNVVVPRESNAGARVCVIGEAPGEQEENAQRPFVGASGNELVKALRRAGLRRGDVHITNVLLCRPPSNDLKKLLQRISRENKARDKEWRDQKKANEKEGLPAPPPPSLVPTPMECCTPRLEREMADYTDFITLGKTATSAVAGTTTGIQKLRGGLMELGATDRTPLRRVMPTVHPAFVLRAPRWRHVFFNDVVKGVRWFNGDAKWIPPKATYNPSAEELDAFLFGQGKGPYVFDIETDGIESLTAKIRCIAIGTSDEVVCVSLLGKDGFRRFYPEHEEQRIIKVLKDFFEDPTRVKAGHNAGYYDRIVLESNWGIQPSEIIDTILLHRNVESELPHGLAYVASLFTEAPAWKCYDPETEVLTPGGWVKFPELEKGVPVAQWDEGVISFVSPSAYVDQPYAGKMWGLTSQATDLLVSPDHKMIWRSRFSPGLRECKVQDLPKTGMIPHTGVGEGTEEVDENLVKLIVAFQADGSWGWQDKARTRAVRLDFGFTRARKIDRLKGILERLGMAYDERKTGTVNPRTRIWVDYHENIDRLWDLMGREKHFGAWLLRWDLAARLTFLEELPLWDGTKNANATQYTSTKEVNSDWVQACAVISGRSARKATYPSSKKGANPNHRVSLVGLRKRSRDWSKIDNMKREEIDYDGRIYCVSVPAGFLLVRRNGKVTVSGNTDREGNKLSTDAESDEELAEYCVNDTAITARCLVPLVDQVRLRDQVGVWQMDQKVQSVCVDMHTIGMYVDQERRLAKEKALLSRRHELLTEIRDRTGRHEFNPGSVYQVRDLLFDTWKLDPPLDDNEKYTASDDPSTADIVLRSLLMSREVPEDQREIIKLLRYYRKVMKVLGTYVVKLRPWDMGADLGWDEDDDWVDKETRKKYGEVKRGIVDPRTGRMHPGWNAHVAATGRLSSSKPINAQNFPYAMRTMVTAAPGNVLVGADADQLEIRVAAAHWGVEKYLRAFEQGKDPHSMTAFMVFGDRFCQAAGIDPRYFEEAGKLVGKAYDDKGTFIGKGEAKNLRSLSKAVHFASQYMAGVERVHKMIQSTETDNGDGTTDLPYAKLPLRRIRQMRENWLSGATEYEAGWNREITAYRQSGYLAEPVTGRRRDFLDGENPNELANFPIQGGAAGLMNISILQLHEAIPRNKWGPGTGIIGQVHDWIGVECPADKAEEVKGLLEECMNQTHPNLPGVKFTATADVGHSWDEV